MKKLFANGDFKEFKASVENKKIVLIICQTDITSFGLLIVDPIIFNGQWRSSSLISAINILDRKEFRGKGRVEGKSWGSGGRVRIGHDEVVILVNGKGNYEACSYSDRDILKIS